MIKKWLYRLWFSLFPKQGIKQMNKKLQTAVLNAEKEKVKLANDIKYYIINSLKINRNSKFIPLSVRKQACEKINNKFGKRMRECRLKVNINLQIVKV